MTHRIVDVAYRPQARAPWDEPTNYARTLLILALAVAGLGDLDQAVTAGTAAIDCGRIVWPTMALTASSTRPRTSDDRRRTDPQRVAAVEIEALPPDGEPVALVLFGTNQAAPAQIAAARYYADSAPLVIATGGVNRHNGIIEGREFARQLTEAGVPAGVIRVED
jgi:hypothetical protein